MIYSSFPNFSVHPHLRRQFSSLSVFPDKLCTSPFILLRASPLSWGRAEEYFGHAQFPLFHHALFLRGLLWVYFAFGHFLGWWKELAEQARSSDTFDSTDAALVTVLETRLSTLVSTCGFGIRCYSICGTRPLHWLSRSTPFFSLWLGIVQTEALEILLLTHTLWVISPKGIRWRRSLQTRSLKVSSAVSWLGPSIKVSNNPQLTGYKTMSVAYRSFPYGQVISSGLSPLIWALLSTMDHL